MGDVEKNRVIVAAVVEAGLGVSETARRFGVSRQWVHRLVARYRAEGPPGVEPGSRRPRSSPTATPQPVREQILALRTDLLGEGLDAGAESIRDRLLGSGIAAPSTSTIWRILRANDLVVAQPHKRPRSSWRRFQAAAPNGCWQSDFTHWQLADGSDVEIITWIDDHSRFLLHLSAHQRITGPTAPCTGPPQPRPTPPCPKQNPKSPPAPDTGEYASTPSTPPDESACATPDAYATSVSAAPTPAPTSSSSSPPPTS